MRTSYILVALTLLFCSACSVKVVPVASPTGTINHEEKSITETRGGVSLTVKLAELSVSPYEMVDNITSFHVSIENRTGAEVTFPSHAFLLRDGSKRQYRSITPEQVRDIVSKETVYLIPYPYVGYYYLEDQAKVSNNDTFSSSLPFYAQYHPQDIFTQALTDQPILSGSHVSGLVYFVASLERTDFAELMVFQNGNTSGEPLAKFQFSIKK